MDLQKNAYIILSLMLTALILLEFNGYSFSNFSTTYLRIVVICITLALLRWYMTYWMAKEEHPEAEIFLLKRPVIRWQKMLGVLIIGLSLSSGSQFSKIMLALGILMCVEEIVNMVLQKQVQYHRLVLNKRGRMIYYGDKKIDVGMYRIGEVGIKKGKLQVQSEEQKFSVDTRSLNKEEQSDLLSKLTKYKLFGDIGFRGLINKDKQEE